MLPVRPARSFDEMFPKPVRYEGQNQNQSTGTGFNLFHNLQQHQQAPLPTYRINSPGISIQPTININVQTIERSFFEDDDQHATDMPFIFDDFLKMLHDFGYIMLKDDAHDIGFLRYQKRRGYPPHLSRLHHWYIGAGLMTLAQVGGMISKMKEFMELGAGMGGQEMMELMGGLVGEEMPLEDQQQLPPLRIYGNSSFQQETNQPPLIYKKPPKALAPIPALPETVSSQNQNQNQKPRLTVPTAPKLRY